MLWIIAYIITMVLQCVLTVYKPPCGFGDVEM